MQQSTDNLNSTQLQPQGSNNIQPGQANLQTQSTDNTAPKSQATGQPQQDALGIESYKSYDGLSVQGSPAIQQKKVTVGNTSSDIFIAIVVVFFVAAAIVFRRYLKLKQSGNLIIEEPLADIITDTVDLKVESKPSTKKHPKKNSSKNKVVKKIKPKTKNRKK